MDRHRIPVPAAALLVLTAASFLPAWCAQEPAAAPAGEQIQSFDSDITVRTDATLQVRETIAVFATGDRIKHGIYRDFPTRYSDRFGNPYLVHLEVISVERDGQPEDFHLGKLSNGLRIYMGKSGEAVPPGPHTYELTYVVDREVGFFPDHDELYWNVTGNGWIFPMQSVSAVVHLPKGIVQEAIIPDAYTGRQGSVQNDSTATTDNQSEALFRTNRALGPHEGLTIVVRWPKGFVSPPTDEQKHQYFLEDNRSSIAEAEGLLVVVLYYAVAWFLVGRAPARGDIVPTSEPPRGFSPAALRYVWRMAFDRKAMIANLVDLAVKKRVAILEDASGGFILGRVNAGTARTGARSATRSQPAPEITADEKLVLDRLFAAGDTLRLGPAHHTQVGGAAEALHQHLRAKLEKVYFLTNSRFLVPGLLISLAAVIRSGLLIQGAQPFLVIFLAIWLLIWSFVSLTIASLTAGAWRSAFSDPHHAPIARKRALIMSVIGLPFVLGEVGGLVALAWGASTELAVVLVVLVAISYIFHILLKAPTRLGRSLLDQIEGFRQYLNSTEHDRRGVRTSAQSAPLLFERLLPYAMALNVEKTWNEKFAAALGQGAAGEATDYSPAWYSGPAWDRITAGSFANSLGNSFTSAIAASSSAPGSSSGSTGSSGGGGGGGGGW